jgi:rRNA maturation endonuclease Nob1
MIKILYNARRQALKISAYDGTIRCLQCGFIGTLFDFPNGKCRKCGGPGVVNK